MIMAHKDSSELEEQLPAQGLLFFDHLYGEYLALRAGGFPIAPTPEALSAIDDVYKNRQDGSLTWNHLYTFDLILSRLQLVEKLNRKVWNLRARYRDVAGLKEYDAYLASKPPDWAQAGPTEEANLRADIEYLLGELYLRYAVIPIRDKVRDQITKRVSYTVLAWLGFVAVAILMMSYFELQPFTASIVIFVGAIGGLMSLQQRYQSLPEEGDTLRNVSELIQGKLSLFQPAIIGGIFAVLLYLLVLAGLLQGGLFPEMVRSNSTQKPGQTIQGSTDKPTPVSFLQFLDVAEPNSATDYAKLLVWSFIAGFAERFIPDTLSRIVARKESDAGAKA